MKSSSLTLFFKFCAAVAIVFGGIDLYLKQSVFFKYEAALTNVFTAGFFGMTLRSGKSIIQEFAEPKMAAAGKVLTAEHVVYFRLLTFVWTAYFILKAAVYAWIAARYGLEKSLVIRMVVGNISLYALMGVSMFMSKPIFIFLKKRGMLSSSTPAPTLTLSRLLGSEVPPVG